MGVFTILELKDPFSFRVFFFFHTAPVDLRSIQDRVDIRQAIEDNGNVSDAMEKGRNILPTVLSHYCKITRLIIILFSFYF